MVKSKMVILRQIAKLDAGEKNMEILKQMRELQSEYEELIAVEKIVTRDFEYMLYNEIWAVNELKDLRKLVNDICSVIAYETRLVDIHIVPKGKYKGLRKEIKKRLAEIDKSGWKNYCFIWQGMVMYELNMYAINVLEERRGLFDGRN